MEDTVVKQVLSSRGTPGRCEFAWINDQGDWVRCLNNRGATHGDTHQHALDEVQVGAEDTVQGLYVENARDRQRR